MHRVEKIVNHFSAVDSNNCTLSNNCSGGVASQYRYSINSNNLLSQEQRDFYEENGYLLIKNLVHQEDLDRYKQQFIGISDGKIDRAPTMTMMRDIAIAKRKELGEKSITKLQDWQDDEVLFSYCKHAEVTKYVEAIIGPSFKSIHTMLINKPPDVGMGSSRHPAHQDLWYFPIRPANRIVATWTAMQHIDRVNGCLYVKPGSHKQEELYKHTYPNDGVVNKAYHGIHTLTEADGEKMLHVVMEPGDTLFFHPLLIHGSGRNNSSGYRKAISCHYAAADCEYIDVRGTLQQEIATEIEEMALKKQGLKVDYVDIWKLKSRQIQGAENMKGLGSDRAAYDRFLQYVAQIGAPKK
jgi:phytanoyl-CoA hydroxylase